MAKRRHGDFAQLASAVCKAAAAGSVNCMASVWRRNYEASGVSRKTPRVRRPVCVQQGGQDYTFTCREASLQAEGGQSLCSPSINTIASK